MRLCVIYNFAPHYRQGIFKRMDDAFECDWYFGKSNQDIRKMDYLILRGTVTEVETMRIGGLTFQKRILGLLNRYDRFLMLGDSRSISTWLFLLFARCMPRKKVYLWSHGFYGKESASERMCKKFIFKLADGIFLYNGYARNLMIGEGLDAKKLFVIHNSLDYDKQIEIRRQLRSSDVYVRHFGNTVPNIIFIGRLTKVKKLDMLLDAAAIMKTRNVPINVTFIGDGSQREQLESKVRDLGLEDSVWFYGACYDELKNAELIYNADLCVAPGNVGLTAMHTMVFGTPVITHNDFKWQMPEFEAITSGRTGDFFKADDVGDLAQTIEKWIYSTGTSRDRVRKACCEEIDCRWNPKVQIEVLKKNMDLHG